MAYNKVNHYTATKFISQEQFQSRKVEQCCLLGQSFIKSASIFNKHFVSEEISGKLELCVDSLKQLLNLFAMEWTEGAVGDQPLGPIFLFLILLVKLTFCLVLLQKEKIQVIKVQ